MSDHILGLLMTQILQITALAIVVAVVAKLAAKNRPHLAHALWVLVLIKCVTPPVWGHSRGVFSQLQARLMPDESASLPDASDSLASVPVAMAEILVPVLEIDVPDPEHGMPEPMRCSAIADGSSQPRSPAVRPDTMNNPATVSITAAAESLERFPHHKRTEFDSLNSGNLDESRYRKTNIFPMRNYSGWAITTDRPVNIAAESTDDCDSRNLCAGQSR
ncbi:MAG: hypothetical protein WKF77_26030 [Planctomycetaceae bacterium]